MQNNKVTVATLNFAGINSSPFEYHDGSPELQQLNQIFIQNMKKEPICQTPDFKWNMGRIDFVIKKERYSPLYQKDVCVLHGKLINQYEYRVIWNYTLSKALPLLHKTPPTPENIEVTYKFDWLVYTSILMYVYGKDQFDISKIKEYDPKKYSDFLNEWHSRPYLKCQTKIADLRAYIVNKSLDIFFVQEALTTVNWNVFAPTGYKCVINEDGSAIFYKKRFFTIDQDQQFAKEYGPRLNFNHDTVWLKCNNDKILLLSIHLTSKNTRFQQLKEVQDQLTRINQQFPELTIIAGLDANQEVESFGNFEVFPNHNNNITTAKKRTHMQAQYHKSDILIQEAKDYIISNNKMTDGVVETIKMDLSLGHLIPNIGHPFDHFVVSTVIHDVFQESNPCSPTSAIEKGQLPISSKTLAEEEKQLIEEKAVG